jgi:tetratricopeptide (TPR) repeat protein
MRRIAILVVVALARAAHADDAADAEALFKEGVAAKDAGKPEEACAKFRESLDKNRNAVGTILNVALCDEQEGKIGSAHKLFTEAAERAKEQHLDEHLKAAEEHRQKLAVDVPRLTVAFTEIPPDTKLVVGGEVIDPKNAADLEVDPGPLKIVASAPGRVPFETTITVGKRDHKAVAVPVLGYPVEDKGRGTLGKVIAISGGVATLAGVAIGYYASRKYNDEFTNGDCVMKDAPHPMCSPNGYAKTQSASTLGWVGTTVGVAGVVAIGVGVTLWLTAPRHEQAKPLAIVPTVSPEQVGLTAVGRF